MISMNDNCPPHCDPPTQQSSTASSIMENAISVLENVMKSTERAVEQELNSPSADSDQGRSLRQHRPVTLFSIIQSEP